MQRLIPARCCVVVVDVQDKLAAAMPAAQMAELMRATSVLLEACKLLGARAVYTEQYPAGLGPTVADLHAPLAAVQAARVEKVDFSAADEPAFSRALADTGAKTAIVVGMESHVCVFQTVRELRARGVEVHVPIDGVASRKDDHRAAGLALCREAGATLTTMETVVFDWLRRAGSAEFKALSKRIR